MSNPEFNPNPFTENGNIRANLDRDFGSDDKEKLKYVQAQLESLREQLKNLGDADSVNYTADNEITEMTNLDESIQLLETIEQELLSITRPKATNEDTIIDTTKDPNGFIN